MSTFERSGFNMSVTAATLGHHRVLTHIIRKHCDLSYNEFTTLLLLDSVSGEVGLHDLASYEILAWKTILTILTHLEGKGLVVKHADERDHRRSTVTTSEYGRSLMQDTLPFIDAVFDEVFCKGLPEEDLARYMNTANMRALLDGIRGHAMRLDSVSDGRRHYSAEHFVFWRALITRWTSIVHEKTGLIFNEFGILTLLDGKGRLDTSDVVKALMIERSEVSVRKTRLVAAGLLTETVNPDDERKTILDITTKGRRVVHKANAALDGFMMGIGAVCDEATAAVINAWHHRMYLNIRVNEKLLNDYDRLKAVLAV